ncbi:hypothetical protein Efla_003997 [Eimeria flavescens]
MDEPVAASRWPEPLSWTYTPPLFLWLRAASGRVCEGADGSMWRPWDAEADDVNVCFEDVTLPLICLALLLAVTPWVSRAAFSSPASLQRQALNRLDAFRQSLTALCCLLPLAFLIGSAVVQSLSLLREQQLWLSLCLLFFLVFFFLQHFAARRGIKQHLSLRLSLGLHFLSQAVKLQSAVRRWHKAGGWASVSPADLEAAVLLFPEFALFFSFCCLASKNERLLGDDASLIGPAHSSPEARASTLSLLTFSWMYPLILKGHGQQLLASDAYELMPQDTAETQTEIVMAAWAAQHAETWRSEQPSRAGPSSLTASTQSSETAASLLSPADRERSRSISSSSGSSSSSSERVKLLRVLWKAYGPTCLGSAAYKLVYDLLQFAGPVILQQIILFLQRSGEKSVEPPPFSEGLTYCLLLLLSSATQTALLHQYFHRQFRLGMRLRVAVSSLIYRKALKIQARATGRSFESQPPNSTNHSSSSSPGGRTTGQYVNLLAVDAQRLEDLMAYVHILWSAPLQISIALFLLFRLLGLAALGGLAVMLLNGPLTGFIGRQATRMQRRLMGIRDERGTAVTELLSGIKAIKMYAWECSFFARISQVRERELKALTAYWRLMVASRTQWLGTPICVSVATFGCYILLHGDIDAATAFTAIALFNVLRFPMQVLPMTTNNTLEARVALTRLQAFLDQEEAQGLPPLTGADEKRAAFPCTDTTATPPPQFTQTADSEGEAEEEAETKQQSNKHLPASSLPAVQVRHASFAWPNGAPLLKDISFHCRKGELVGIVGSTGAGKSGLLLSLLGSTVRVPSRRGASRRGPQGGPLLNPLTEEGPGKEGLVSLRGSVAYCSQVAWIQSATLKENVLFGSPMDEDWYYQVLEACALLPDIAALPGGDETEIGERGVNLSGGQKQRVALARAVYRQSDVYLLDDCLSAVDVHVAQHVFERCLKGLLKDKAVLLVSHRLAVLPGCDAILFISKGTQRHFGSLQEARNIAEFNLFAATSERAEEEADGDVETCSNRAERQAASAVQTNQQGRDAQAAARASASSSTVGQRRAAGALTDEEVVQTGAVPFAVYAEYLQSAGGWFHVGLSVLMMFLGAVLLALSNVWLSAWADKRVATSRGVSLGIFVALSVAHLIVSILSYTKVASGAVSAARYYHEKLLRSILDAPMAFFDSTPTGRLLNRLTKSIYGIDEALPSAMLAYMTTLMACVMTVGVISFVFPAFLVVVAPLLYYYVAVQNFYIPTSRQLKRIEAVTRSPVFSHFQETIEGTETIRAFREEDRFFQTSTDKLNANTRIYYMSIAANRWLAVRLETVGTVVVVSSAVFAILGRGYISGGLGGLAVSYALSVTQQLNWLVRMASDREAHIVAVERVEDYATGVAPEKLEPPAAPAAPAAADARGGWRQRVPEGWPLLGAIKAKDLCVRYRPDLPLVLKSISFDVRPGEKVGLVGRTGAGKSSLLISLLRLVEPASGHIEIDGVDIQSVGLRFLRSRFSIIPQDPVLFAGSLRFNIDAQGEHTDRQIWEALEGAHLAAAVRSMTARERRTSVSSTSSSNRSRGSNESIRWEASAGEDSLEAAMLPSASPAADAVSVEVEEQGLNPLDLMVEEGGRNFSLGQRQLICLARALLRRSRILLLDEATAVVDPRTDRLIQDTIKEDFKDCTVITIAHRIDTIVNYDRVLVLSDGKIEEFDSPRVLFAKKDSFFRSLCLQAGVQPDKS